MEQLRTDNVSFFLGANTPAGFSSLFDELLPADGWRLFILKGGPGTGKSTLLKRVAKEADRRGLYNERIFCSSDPKSLDGVIVPSLRVSVADGTAPHVLEPVYPGARETVVDLGACRNDRLLFERRAEVIRLTDKNRAMHAGVTRFLAAAAAAKKEALALTSPAVRTQAVETYLMRLIERAVPAADGQGSLARRYLRAVTPEGVLTFRETVSSLSDRVLWVSDPNFAVADALLPAFAEAALRRGARTIVCPSFLSPGQPMGVILPDAGFSLAEGAAEAGTPGEKTVRCERFYDRRLLSENASRLRFVKKARREFIGEAVKFAKLAKDVHDELEAVYASAMDFGAVEKTGDRVLEEIFG